MSVQQERAESRLYALNQIIELLSTGKGKDEGKGATSSPTTTLLNSVHLQVGFFLTYYILILQCVSILKKAGSSVVDVHVVKEYLKESRE